MAGWRRVALALIACALLLRIALPAGWMPQADAAGVSLSWCDDSGLSGAAALTEAKALLAEAVGKKSQPDHSGEPCGFAAGGHALAAVEAPTMPPAPLPQASPAPPALALLPGRGLAAPPPHSTGPPLAA